MEFYKYDYINIKLSWIVSQAWLSNDHLTIVRLISPSLHSSVNQHTFTWFSSVQVGARGGMLVVRCRRWLRVNTSAHYHHWLHGCTVGGDSSCQHSSSSVSGSGSDRRQKKAAHIREHITEEHLPAFLLCIVHLSTSWYPTTVQRTPQQIADDAININTLKWNK